MGPLVLGGRANLFVKGVTSGASGASIVISFPKTFIVLGFAFYAFYQDIEQIYFRRYDESGNEKHEDFEPDPDLAREDMME